MPKLMHPASGQEIEAAEERVPLYVSQGWRRVSDDTPKATAPLKVWQEFARSKGFTDDDLKGMKRDEIRAALA